MVYELGAAVLARRMGARVKGGGESHIESMIFKPMRAKECCAYSQLVVGHDTSLVKSRDLIGVVRVSVQYERGYQSSGASSPCVGHVARDHIQ